MIIIYVKHYLNNDGIGFFNNTWFPEVKFAISLQSGFISIESQGDKYNSACVNITLKFENWENLDAWTKTKVHDVLVDQLDPYRISDWEVAKIESDTDKNINLAELVWERVTPRNVAYDNSL